MSIKHVENYYNEARKTYIDMQNTLHIMEKEASEGLVLPETVSQMKQMIAPLMDNYQKLSYVMFLLHQPTKKDKQKGYEKRNHKLLKECSGKDSKYVINQNKKSIEQLSNLKNQ